MFTMPTLLTATGGRLENSRTWLTTAVGTLEMLSNGSNLPFLESLSVTIRALLTSVETVRHNKNDCAQLMERVHEILYGIIELHIKSNTGGQLPPSSLNQIGQFTKTLHKIRTFVDAQQEKNILKQLLRHSELNGLWKECNVELQLALDIFKIQGTQIFTQISIEANMIDGYAKKTHQEVLDMIQSLSDDTNSDKVSSIHRVFSGDYNSSNSLSLLPSEPKIFHGRDSEVVEILKSFDHEVPRIAILGPGGIGKTSLAKAILHHQEISARYNDNRVFVACDSASTKQDLVALIGSHLGLDSKKDLTQAVVKQFTQGPLCLLVLDNLETAWEPTKSRRDIEEFLCLLADVQHLALMITMRGAERPAKLQWTRPFLKPLLPLTQDAARQTFIEIAEDQNEKDMDKILSFTGNMPLAIDLLAHLVASDGCESVLLRWENLTTSILSEGYDRRSNLDLSISLSLSSPRITSAPQARDLLGLLSMLPDGLSDVDLQQSNIPVNDILSCKAILLRTSLAYVDGHGRLMVLVPIREFMQKLYLPAPTLVEALLKHFTELLEIFRKFDRTGVIARITSNFANIHKLLMNGLQENNPDLKSTIQHAFIFTSFARVTGRGHCQFLEVMHRISNLLHWTNDHALEIHFIIATFNYASLNPIYDPEAFVKKGLEHFQHLQNPELQCDFYVAIGGFYMRVKNDLQTALAFLKSAQTLSKSKANPQIQMFILNELAWAHFQLGDYSAGQMHAYETLRLAKLAGTPYYEALAMRVEAVCWLRLCDLNRTVNLCKTARDLLRLIGMSYSELDHVILVTQNSVYFEKTEFADAYHILSEAQKHISLEDSPYRYAYTLLSTAELEVIIGTEKEVVMKHLETAKSIFSHLNLLSLVTLCDIFQAGLDLREGKLLAAHTRFHNSLKSVLGKNSEYVTICLGSLGDKRRWGTTNCISNWTIVFLVYSLKTNQKLGIYKALQFLGYSFLSIDDLVTSAHLLDVALEAFTILDIHLNRAECMLSLGDISMKQEDFTRALQLWEAARPLFERSSQAKEIVLLEERIAVVTQRILDTDQEKLVLLSGLHLPTDISELSAIQVDGKAVVNGGENVFSDETKDKVPLAI